MSLDGVSHPPPLISMIQHPPGCNFLSADTKEEQTLTEWSISFGLTILMSPYNLTRNVSQLSIAY